MNMSKRTLALVGILIVIVVILFVVALNPKNATAPAPFFATPTAVPTPVAQSLLSFNPNPLLMASSSASVDVVVNSDVNQVTGVQLELQYDPKVIRVLNIRPGSFFTNSIELIKTIDATQGRVSYALGLQPSEVAKSGSGVVATLTVAKVSAAQTATISILPKSLVSAQGVESSVLKSATD
jgi:hypothetical protein